MRPKDHKKTSLSALSGNWAIAIIATLLYLIAVGILSNIPSVFANPEYAPGTYSVLLLLVTFLLVAPIEVGYANAFRYHITRDDTDFISNTFKIGFSQWIRTAVGILLATVYIVLWCCLFVIPGIIMSFAYAMVPYILIDRPDLSISQAVRESRLMMRGHKWDLFILSLSFLGWILLSIITFGLGFLFLLPYMQGAIASFYESIKPQPTAEI